MTDNASEMRSRRVSMEAQNDYRNAAIDLGNQNQTAKQQDNAAGISSTRRAKYARDEPADANQIVDLALITHNVSFLYQLMNNDKKFNEINVQNIQRLL